MATTPTWRGEDRLIASPGLGREELGRLQRAEVAVVGTGALGGQLSVHLGLLGVPLVLIDSGRVEPENLGNQALPAASLGQPKSVVRARQIADLNPACPTRAVPARIEDIGLGTLAGVDLLATGLDGRAARARVNEIAWRLGIPWVDAAVDGSGRWLRGTVTVYDPRRPGAACYLCSRDASELASIAREGRPAGCPSWRSAEPAAAPPTLQASALAAIVAGFQALAATRLLLGRGGDLAGHQLLIECDGPARIRQVALARNPRCVFDHRRTEPLADVRGETVGELLAAAAAALDAEVEELVLHGRTLLLGLACPRCGAARDVARLARTCSDEELACNCTAGAEMAPASLSERLPGPVARRLASLTWQEIGLPPGDIVTASAGGRAAHYRVAAHLDRTRRRPRQ